MTLPCLGGADGHDACRREEPCTWKRQIIAMTREPSWVEEHGKCDELRARREGWQEVGDA